MPEIMELKIFDMRHPDCEFIKPANMDIFYGVPILYKDEVIGHATDNYYSFEWIEEELWANVYIYDKYKDFVDRIEYEGYNLNIKEFVKGCYKINYCETVIVNIRGE